MKGQQHPESAPVPKIHAAIMAIMNDIDAIEKTRENTGQHFMFRGVAETLAKCHPLFIKHNVYIRPLKVAYHSMDANPDKDGKARGTHVFQTIVYRATSAEDGSFIDGEASGEAIDYQDKSSGKVMSISFKCYIFQLFCIPEAKNENDPDEYSPNGTDEEIKKRAAAEAAEAKAEEARKEKALKSLAALLGKKGIKGKVTVKWISDQIGRTIERLGQLTPNEFDKAKKVAEALSDAEADAKKGAA
jgi:hypothetical protein